ncbi:MAG: 3-deoxy-D-manno-octulosonic acid transferase [Methylococcaceae bacterium]|nr:3-deoxy-D-manno-octulosonic acid transferase [Methylococcaceae bacterium]
MRRLYTALFRLAVPAVVGRLLWRSLKAPAYRQRIPERFGYYPASPAGEHVWIHAVSVGEAEAAFPLLRELMERFPGRRWVVTTTTPTGSRRVREALGERVAHVYLPYDLPGPIGRFLGAFKPCLAVIMETEIWPNLYLSCAAAGIPLAIVNARLSARSAKGYARLGGLTRASLGAVQWIAAQTQADAERYCRLGAAPERVEVAGNLKFDLELPADLVERGRQLKAQLFGDRLVLVAGSTHEGEEAILLDVLDSLASEFPGLILVVAPRHPERFKAVAELCSRRGRPAVRRSGGGDCAGVTVFLLDTLGELRQFYAAGDLAFVGGSLVPVGGHNPLEPAALGLPLLFGPHGFNFLDIGRGLLDGGGALEVADGTQLAVAAGRVLRDASVKTAMGSANRAFVEQGRGAVRRVADRLAVWLAATAD